MVSSVKCSGFILRLSRGLVFWENTRSRCTSIQLHATANFAHWLQAKSNSETFKLITLSAFEQLETTLSVYFAKLSSFYPSVR